ncbi:UNVERIFIED_CONTAM: hypothetical protein HHA_449270 [Hammondia hammondi]|eukprot:XP_008881874.1 hypothetical protein HHA_449270 [Hammondia hammondi]
MELILRKFVKPFTYLDKLPSNKHRFGVYLIDSTIQLGSQFIGTKVSNVSETVCSEVNVVKEHGREEGNSRKGVASGPQDVEAYSEPVDGLVDMKVCPRSR